MKKIIVTDTVREYATMFAEKGEKATLKAWEKAEKTTNYAETVAVTLCLCIRRWPAATVAELSGRCAA